MQCWIEAISGTVATCVIMTAGRELIIVNTNNTLTQVLRCTEAAPRCSLNKVIIQFAVTSHRKDLSVNEEACRILLQYRTELLFGDWASAICQL